MSPSSRISYLGSRSATYSSQAKEDPSVDQVRLAGDQSDWTLYGIHAFVIESQRQATADGCSAPSMLQGMNIDSRDYPVSASTPGSSAYSISRLSCKTRFEDTRISSQSCGMDRCQRLFTPLSPVVFLVLVT